MEVSSLKFIAAACHGQLLSGSADALVGRVCTDSRQVQPGDLFLALRGDRFDGHNFLSEVIAKGTAAIVAERSRIPADLSACPVIAVDDTRQALGWLATRYREGFVALPIIAVGGSNGKTTTKELIAAVLRQKLATLWSEASFNNHIGVPLTLLRLKKSHQAAVVEAGTNHPGEVAPLLKMIRPKYSVLTNIGREHLEFFGDLEGVVAEEGWIAECLPADGRLFINGDSEWTPRLAARTRAGVVRVGLGEGNDWRARAVRLDKRGLNFRVETVAAGFAGEYRIHLLGKHQVVNALFAVAIGAELGLARTDIERGLAECAAPKMRLEFSEHHGVRVLDDTYNANADSMRVALQALTDLPCKGRRVAVLGDMAELGASSEVAHAEVGQLTAELGVGQLFAIGNMASVMGGAARAAGLNRIFEFPDAESAVGAVKGFVKAGDVVLLKASRAVRLERVAEALKVEKA